MIRGYNAAPHTLTVDKVREMREVGYLRSWRCVEPYGFFEDSHILTISEAIFSQGGEVIITILNSNEQILDVNPEATAVFMERYGGHRGKVARALTSGGIRTNNPALMEFIMAEAWRLRALLSRIGVGRFKIELMNPDVRYWGTDWASHYLRLTPDYARLYRMFGTPRSHAYNRSLRALASVFPLNRIKGGFVYAEPDRLDIVPPSAGSVMEFGCNIACKEKFIPALGNLMGVWRAYLQWVVDPRWGGYSDVPNLDVWDAEKLRAHTHKWGVPDEAYCMFPTFTWDHVRSFALAGSSYRRRASDNM